MAHVVVDRRHSRVLPASVVDIDRIYRRRQMILVDRNLHKVDRSLHLRVTNRLQSASVKEFLERDKI